MITEALNVFDIAKISTNCDSFSKNLRVLSWVFLLPNFLFMIVAQKTFQIDKNAKFSMRQMFESGKKTEVDDLNGAIVRMGEKYKIPTPINQKLVDLVHRAEELKVANYSEEKLFEIIFEQEPFSLTRFMVNLFLILYAVYVIFQRFRFQ
jgi:ketopantoate reductase